MTITKQIYTNSKGQLHSAHGCAYKSCYEGGSTKTKAWYINGKLHSDHCSAFRSYYENGNDHIYIYAKCGKIHREDGPAISCYYEDGTIAVEQYWTAGVIHRKQLFFEYDPSIITYYKSGRLRSKNFILHGKYLSEKECHHNYELYEDTPDNKVIKTEIRTEIPTYFKNLSK